MHLNDKQLLEIDDVGRRHLVECVQCREKAARLVLIRQQLKVCAQDKAPIEIWQNIKHSYKERMAEDRQIRMNNQLWFRRFSPFALAASVAIILFIQWPNSSSLKDGDMLEEKLIAKLIDRNNRIQQELNQQMVAANFTKVSLNNLQMEISKVDQRLQYAYIKNYSLKEKTALWKHREMLLNSLLSEFKQPKTMRI